MNPGFEELKPFSINSRGSTFKGVSGHGIVCDQDGDGVFVVGGWNPGFTAPDSDTHVDRHYVREVWKFSTATRTWIQLRCDDPPISLASHSLVNLGRTSNEGAARLLVFGGSLSARGFMGNSNETYIYHVGEERWEKLATSGTPPLRENGHWFGQAVAKRGNHIYVATGRYLFLNALIDRTELHRLNLQTLVWEELSVQLGSCRVRHEIVVDEDEKVYVLGGALEFDGQGFKLEHIPYFDAPSRRWCVLRTSPDSTAGFPKQRSSFGSVIFGEYAYIVGGHFRDVWDGNYDYPAEAEALDDLWRLHLPTGQWHKYAIKLPRPLWFHAVDVDRDGVLYVFGGCTAEVYSGERTTQLWSVKLVVPTLKRLAWDKVVKCSSHSLGKLSSEDVCNQLALPASFVVPKVSW